MDFDDDEAAASFRAEARDWLDRHAPRDLLAEARQSGPGTLALGVETVPTQKAWQRLKYDNGWACLHWPSAYGGRDASPIQRLIWQQEEGAYARLSSIFHNGQGMCGPTLMAFAAEEHKRALLPAIASGEEIWCQLFSEPSAGSDLAGVRTRAARDGDGWVIDGQKIWTSGAQVADWGLLLARTDFDQPKHRGLTMFFLRMDAPGVEIRPIRQMNGQAEFNEVFLSGVRIPDVQRVGDCGDGWRVALTTLMNERLSIGTEMPTGFEELADYCVQAGHTATDDVRERIGHFASLSLGLRNFVLRSISHAAAGGEPGSENAIIKLVASSMMQDIASLGVDLQDQYGILEPGSDGLAAGRFQALLLRAPGTRIEGGSDEVLRNIIAERVLGLSPDIRTDKDRPFNQLPR